MSSSTQKNQDESRLVLERNPRRGEHLEVLVTRLTPKGIGECKLPVLLGPQKDPRVYTVHVRKVLPGERVIIEVERCKRGVVEGRLLERLESSHRRITPRCGHFGLRGVPRKGCGGCTLQSLGYQDQLATKEENVRSLLASQGLDTGLMKPILPSPTPWFYRNKMEFSFGDDHNRDSALGLYPSGWRREVIDIEACYLLSEGAVTIAREIHRWTKAAGLVHLNLAKGIGFMRTLTIREGKRTGQRMIEWTTSADPEVMFFGRLVDAELVGEAFAVEVEAICTRLGESLTSLYWTQHRAVKGERTQLISHNLRGAPVLAEKLELPGGVTLEFEIHPRAFFQPNTLSAEVLYEQVVLAAGIDEGKPSRVLDLYCGTGTIGLALAPYVKDVVGIEMQPAAVDNARRNAQLNGMDNVTFFCGDVAKVLQAEDLMSDIDLVVVDPPRAGLKADARALIGEIGAERLVVVSCNPKTLARDLADLTVNHGYTLEEVQPLDQFPHTMHIENIALLKKNEAC